jgi:chaperonin GroEL (HSP60 family)
MSAKLATVDGLIWACVDEAGRPVRDGSMLEHSASDKPRVGSTEFDSGYLSPHFVTDPERMEVVFENVYVLIHEKKLSSKNDLLPLLEQIVRSSRPLLIIAEDFGGEALAALVVNKLRGPLQVVAVRAPDSGNGRKGLLQDIAFLTGSKAISEDLDLKLRDVQISDLGQAKKVIIDKNTTVIEGNIMFNTSEVRQPVIVNRNLQTVLPIQAKDGLRKRCFVPES